MPSTPSTINLLKNSPLNMNSNANNANTTKTMGVGVTITNNCYLQSNQSQNNQLIVNGNHNHTHSPIMMIARAESAHSRHCDSQSHLPNNTGTPLPVGLLSSPPLSLSSSSSTLPPHASSSGATAATSAPPSADSYISAALQKNSGQNSAPLCTMTTCSMPAAQLGQSNKAHTLGGQGHSIGGGNVKDNGGVDPQHQPNPSPTSTCENGASMKQVSFQFLN